MKESTDQPRILFLDIEATGLRANFGHMLCCGFKWADEPNVFVHSIITHPGRKVIPPDAFLQKIKTLYNARHQTDGGISAVAEAIRSVANQGQADDSALTLAVANVIDEADIVVTYFGKRYDIPFINTRLLEAQRGRFLSLIDASHVDLWETCKKKLKLSSNRLASVIDFLKLKNEKSPVKGPLWVAAGAGDRSALRYIVEHCEADVLALEEAYNILLPLIGKHPRTNIAEPLSCINCGSPALAPRGWYATASFGRKRRYTCNNCGKWNKSSNGHRSVP